MVARHIVEASCHCPQLYNTARQGPPSCTGPTHSATPGGALAYSRAKLLKVIWIISPERDPTCASRHGGCRNYPCGVYTVAGWAHQNKQKRKKLLLDTFVQNSAVWDSSGAGLSAWSAERSLLGTSDITSFLEINGWTKMGSISGRKQPCFSKSEQFL